MVNFLFLEGDLCYLTYICMFTSVLFLFVWVFFPSVEIWDYVGVGSKPLVDFCEEKDNDILLLPLL